MSTFSGGLKAWCNQSCRCPASLSWGANRANGGGVPGGLWCWSGSRLFWGVQINMLILFMRGSKNALFGFIENGEHETAARIRYWFYIFWQIFYWFNKYMHLMVPFSISVLILSKIATILVIWAGIDLSIDFLYDLTKLCILMSKITAKLSKCSFVDAFRLHFHRNEQHT